MQELLCAQWAILLARGREVVATRQQLLEPDLRADDRGAKAFLAAPGAFELARAALTTAIAPTRPGRGRSREANRPDVEQDRHEQADQTGPDLALEQRDHRQAQLNGADDRANEIRDT